MRIKTKKFCLLIIWPLVKYSRRNLKINTKLSPCNERNYRCWFCCCFCCRRCFFLILQKEMKTRLKRNKSEWDVKHKAAQKVSHYHSRSIALHSLPVGHESLLCRASVLAIRSEAERRSGYRRDSALSEEWRRRFPSRLQRHARLPPSYYSSPARFPPGRPAGERCLCRRHRPASILSRKCR